jgi:hypothetical protein
MKPVDHVNPTVPSNWVRRVEEKRRPRDQKRRQPDEDPQNRNQKHPPGPDPDGRTHIIDDLA